VLLTGRDVQLVSSAAVERMELSESAGAPLDSPDSRIAQLQWPDPAMFSMGLLEGHA
jgi:hypothetical protein